jgi:hypothetical protein
MAPCKWLIFWKRALYCAFLARRTVPILPSCTLTFYGEMGPASPVSALSNAEGFHMEGWWKGYTPSGSPFVFLLSYSYYLFV